MHNGQTRSVRHQTAGVDVFAEEVDRWQVLPRSQLRDSHAVDVYQRIPEYNDRVRTGAGGLRERGIELACRLHFDGDKWG